MRTRLATFLTEDPVEGPKYLENVPLGRFAEPEDIAKAIVFLASDDAAYVAASERSVGTMHATPDQVTFSRCSYFSELSMARTSVGGRSCRASSSRSRRSLGADRLRCDVDQPLEQRAVARH